MDANGANDTYTYVIDEEDRIVHVSDNWLAFAEENQAGASCHPDRILNQSIWNFVDGVEATHLYETMIKRIRQKHGAISFPFRCDSPDKRRYLELTMVPLNTARIEFTSRIIREEPRDVVELLAPDAARSDEILTICSMCKKVKLEPPDDRWVEVEAAVEKLRLFEKDVLPQLSHGLCRDCFAAGMAEIGKIRDSRLTHTGKTQEGSTEAE